MKEFNKYKILEVCNKERKTQNGYLWKYLKLNTTTRKLQADENVELFYEKEIPQVIKNKKNITFNFKDDTKTIDKKDLSENGLIFIRYDNCKIRNYNKDKDPTVDTPENGCYNLMYDIIELKKCNFENENVKCQIVNENKPTDKIIFNFEYNKSDWLSKLFGTSDAIKPIAINYSLSI